MKCPYIMASLASTVILCSCGGDSGTSANETYSSSETIASSSSSLNPETVEKSSCSAQMPSSSSFLQQFSSSSSSVPKGAEKLSSSVADVERPYPDNYNVETGLLTDERDGNVYRTAKVGNQIWMSQNLRMENPPLLDRCENPLLFIPKEKDKRCYWYEIS
ncbi:MAG: hypothetical protein HUK19_03265 [Fibrobacter sp.]|nr:hypothetical protein [Fibrobacter sp.]